MKVIETVPPENVSLLIEIANLKTEITQLYHQHGPGSSDYISLSIKLDLLINEYIEEKIIHLL